MDISLKLDGVGGFTGVANLPQDGTSSLHAIYACAEGLSAGGDGPPLWVWLTLEDVDGILDEVVEYRGQH